MYRIKHIRTTVTIIPKFTFGIRAIIIKISVIFAVTGSLKSFDLIYVLTNGGPLHSTEVPSTLMISMLFLRNRYGMGSTIAVLLIVLCFAFALLINFVFREED